MRSIFFVSALLLVATTVELVAEVRTEKLPPLAYRAQAVLDAAGTVHIVHARRQERGNLYYMRRRTGDAEFSDPIRVNSTPNCAAGFSFAVGSDGRVHVLIRATAEYSKQKLGRPVKFYDLKFMLYARLSDDGESFEAERDLSGNTFGFEGVGTVIAGEGNRVYVYWHGLETPGLEPTRGIYVVQSTDAGRSFSEPNRIECDVIGACACCSMTGTRDPDGNIYLAFRSSEPAANKDSYLLTSRDGVTFESSLLESWENAGCPGSIYSLAASSKGVYVAWDTQGEIRFAESSRTGTPVTAPSLGMRSRTPRLVSNSRGDILFVWSETSEARGFMKGADLAWQVFDSDGQPISEKQVLQNGVAGGWSMPAAYALASDDFVILYDGQ